jgi:hypothetical protein
LVTVGATIRCFYVFIFRFILIIFKKILLFQFSVEILLGIFIELIVRSA